MKAIVQDRYGPFEQVLHLSDREVPVPLAGQVLLRVHAASVHPDVWHAVTASPHMLRLFGSGLFKPKFAIPGTDAAGTVFAVGEKVTRFRVGDAVFGETHVGLQWKNGGAYAEYVAVPESELVHKPENVSFEQAASVPTSGIIALINLPDPALYGPGRHVLINGAAGGVGSIVLQVVKAAGGRVTAVDGASKLPLLERLGADRVVDYKAKNPLETSERFDLIYDVASSLKYKDCRSRLTKDGVYVLIGHDHFGQRAGRFWGSIPRIFGLALRSIFDRHLLPPSKVPPKLDSMKRLAALLESGQLSPIVDRVFPLADATEALRALQEGKAAGRLVLSPLARNAS